MTTGEKIACERKKLNLTQLEFADRLKVTRQAVSRWESDLAFPETDKLIQISQLFGCSVDYLLKYNEINDQQENNSENSEGDASSKPFNLRNWHFEYKSEKLLCGLPLVHINIGLGRRAKGFFSVGLVSTGIFSAGLISAGVVSFGLLSAGVIAFGSLVLGGAAIGAIAFGLIAIGGVAAGIIALGGLAVGCYALGGAAIGLFACGGYAQGYYIAVGDYAAAQIAFGKSTASGGEISVTLENYNRLKHAAFSKMEQLPTFWQGFVSLCRSFAQAVMNSTGN